MKILLTGATGFLGNFLLEYFLFRNYDVLITKRATTDLSKIYHRFGNIEAWDTDKLNNIFFVHTDINIIVHAATNYGRDNLSPTSIFWSNEVFPIELMELAINHKITFFNFDTFFNSEKTSYEYLGAYTLSKRHFQEWGQHYAKLGQVNFINLKLHHLYGPGDSFSKFIPSIVSRCLAGEEIDLTNGIHKRDFIYISDVIDAVGVIFESIQIQKCEYYNYEVGTGASISIREFVEMVKNLCSSSSKLNFGALSNRKGEIQNAFAKNENLLSLGWVPKVNIESGIKIVINDIIERNKLNVKRTGND